MAQGTGLRAQGTGRRAQGAGRRAQGVGHRAQGTGHRAIRGENSGFIVPGSFKNKNARLETKNNA